MKYSIVFSLICGVFALNSTYAQQVILNEDFEDGDFTQNPEWVGDTDDWIIVEEDGNNLLRLDGDSDDGGVSHLSTESIANYGSWEFFVRLDGFTTSDNNRARVFIMSDRADVEGDVNGYAVRVGESGGNKFFRIERFDDGSSARVVVTGETLIEADVGYQVRVTRDQDGLWSLFVSEGFGSEPQPEGEPTVDNTWANSEWFGLKARYTATRFDRFFFDNIIVTKDPLFLADVQVQDNQNIDAVFSEAVEPGSVTTNAFSIDEGIGSPDQAELIENNIVRLTFSDPIPGGGYVMSVSGIEDLAGGVMDPAEFEFNVIDEIQPGEVVINEFFYDNPDEHAQYVEIFNNSDKLFNLRDWRIQDNTQTTRRLTTEDFFLEAGEFLVITGDTTGLAEQFGSRNYLEIGNFPSLNRVAPDQIKIFTGDELLVDSLRYEAAVWGGDGVALERISADAVSYSPENWGESNDPLGGTPGLPNDTDDPDLTPLEITFINNIDDQNLVMRFSRHIDRATAETAGNYQIDGGLAIDEAEKTEIDEVELRLNTPMTSNTEYTVTVQDIENIFGTPMPESQASFTFFDVAPVDSGDVFINEFMYDAAPGFSRYIELFNTSDKALSLQGWTTNNDTGNRNTITNENIILAPGEYIVLAPNDDLLSIFPDIDLINMGSRFQALKLGGDDIVLRDADGMLLDSLRYTPGWGGDEVALERRTTEVAAFYPENWGDSPSADLGTPGSPNEIGPDETTPEFVSASALSPDEIILFFSKSMDPETATDQANYQFSPSVDVAEITADKEIIRVFTDTPLTPETTYEVTITGLADIFGNPMETTTGAFTFLETADPEPGDIVVNEFVYRQVSGETPRFIELYNRSDRNLDIHAWQLGRSTSTIQLSGAGGTIPLAAGEYLVISDAPELLDIPAQRAFRVPSMLALSQNGDSIFLRDDDGVLIDSLGYEPGWGGSPAGFSLERLDPESASNDQSNWRTHPEGHSAGEQNANFEPNETEPFAIFANQPAENEIEVRFNEFVNPGGQTQFELNGQPLTIVEFNPFEGNRVFLEPAGSSQNLQTSGDEDDVVLITNLPDVPGNTAQESTIPIARPIQPGDVVINEIMYQPLSGQREFSDQSEYVEFFNTRNYAINLEGFFIHDEPDFEGGISAITPVSTTSGWIPARGYAVIHADPEPEFENTRISRFFEIESDRFFFRADRGTLSLSTQGDSIYLADEDGAVIDSVFYSPDWHNPNLLDTRGIALERISPSGSSNDGTNWGSSVVPEGGTPGGQNSLFAEPESLPDDEGIVLEPNPFSPDAGGSDDNLFINYRLDHPDYLLRVRIYDRYGRLVRTLADGIPAGLEGSLTWDGRRDNGLENRIGIYIVNFEAYNSSDGRNRTFRETVVLARRL